MLLFVSWTHTPPHNSLKEYVRKPAIDTVTDTHIMYLYLHLIDDRGKWLVWPAMTNTARATDSTTDNNI